MQGMNHPLIHTDLKERVIAVAIEPSRQFKHLYLEKRLEIAQIEKLESDTAKNRQIVNESIQNLYGGIKQPYKPA